MRRRVSRGLSVALVLSLLAGCGLVGRKRYTVSSESMEPTFQVGDVVTAVRTDRDYTPRQGDVVFFTAPASWGGDGVRVSRVIGIPGATVACCDGGGRMTVNGRPLEEPYLKDSQASRVAFGPVTVPAGGLWVQGDNRHISLDSRSYFIRDGIGQATVPVSHVVGVAE
ncbi:signal peptidase I [Streptosporangium sp. NPDC048047]|uniref:signal peptidase I n=1 Tax=unclassified Streptosporangium TaxID=2632669 RepID=UPI003420792F